ncbi:hydrogenase maturation protein hypF [Escherichia coli]|uniref:Hydrogenase maturation protein hypF n=1 Tax=Escherichia coli TaxID=562 RepID=A0A376VF15_ECOLX|nr:hydrogenase maturation protein hypF [Escherichia coli]
MIQWCAKRRNAAPFAGVCADALALPPGFKNVPPVLCLGADLKNTFCLMRGEQAVLSQHLGDLSDDGIQMQWREALRLMQNIYDFTPQYVVHDAHPAMSPASGRAK